MLSFFQRKKGEGETKEYEHYPGSGVCDVCNAPIGPNEAFQVPTKVFWASKKYKKWVATNPMTRSMLQMSGATVDQYIAMQSSMDKTKYSAVCAKCVHLFH